MKSNILFIDDEKDIVSSFERSFRKYYNIVTSTSPEIGLELIKNSQPFEVIICDYNMPKMNGIEFLSKALALSPDTIRIMLTGYADLNTVLEAINENKIFKFLLKPITPNALQMHIDEAIELYRLKDYEKNLNKLKSGFLATVSQNYKNPLTGILTTSYLLKEYYNKQDNLNFGKSIKNIQDSVLSMSKIIDKIIFFSNLDTDYKPLIESFNFSLQIQELINSILYSVQNKIIINYKNDCDIKSINSDINLLNIILQNLIENSIENSPENSNIEIYTNCIGNQLSIRVKDYGKGIPASEKKFLFNPFFKSSISHNQKGSGLGLTIVKKAVDLLKGSIKIESDIDKGTEVIILI